MAGKCSCAPQCSGKECGADGCGGQYGSCGPAESCAAGTCEPFNDCGVYLLDKGGCKALQCSDPACPMRIDVGSWSGFGKTFESCVCTRSCASPGFGDQCDGIPAYGLCGFVCNVKGTVTAYPNACAVTSSASWTE